MWIGIICVQGLLRKTNISQLFLGHTHQLAGPMCYTGDIAIKQWSLHWFSIRLLIIQHIRLVTPRLYLSHLWITCAFSTMQLGDAGTETFVMYVQLLVSVCLFVNVYIMHGSNRCSHVFLSFATRILCFCLHQVSHLKIISTLRCYLPESHIANQWLRLGRNAFASWGQRWGMAVAILAGP